MCLVQLHERRLSGAYDIFFTNLWFVGIQIIFSIFMNFIEFSNRVFYNNHRGT